MSTELTNTQNLAFPAVLDAFRKAAEPNTYIDLINCTSAKLRPFEAKYGKQGLTALVSSEISNICKLMSFETSSEMVMAAAELIIEDYPDTKLSDFKMFRKDVLKGKVGGKLFRWDTRTILEAWKEYYANREDAFADYRERRHMEEKQAYLDAYNRIPEKRDMDKEYAILKKQGEMDNLKRKWKTMDLKEICKSQGKDYELLLTVCEHDCREVWTETSVISFDDYLKLHLVRALNEIRADPDRLNEYC